MLDSKIANEAMIASNGALVQEAEDLKKQNEQFASGYEEADAKINKFNEEKTEFEAQIKVRK